MPMQADVWQMALLEKLKDHPMVKQGLMNLSQGITNYTKLVKTSDYNVMLGRTIAQQVINQNQHQLKQWLLGLNATASQMAALDKLFNNEMVTIVSNLLYDLTRPNLSHQFTQITYVQVGQRQIEARHLLSQGVVPVDDDGVLTPLVPYVNALKQQKTTLQNVFQTNF